ncbi:MAG: UDP-N-acetylglucosamine 2-epimerase, partial [Prevotella sp.]|nr:UDP-N-acetylglucosamine 2-epimerase [Prevotella sp.]
TINRKALLADEQNLQRMLDAIADVAADVPVIAPLRQQASQKVTALTQRIRPVAPLSYLDFGYLTAHARGIITDSGNVAEEATFNNVPCITLNSYTEHIETVKQGTNELVGEDADRLRQVLGNLLSDSWKTSSLPDRWDGRTAERIVKILTED